MLKMLLDLSSVIQDENLITFMCANNILSFLEFLLTWQRLGYH